MTTFCSTDEDTNISIATLFQRYIQNYETVVLSQNYRQPDFDNEAPYAKLGSISGLMASCWGVV